jgi:hypothetical protein
MTAGVDGEDADEDAAPASLVIAPSAATVVRGVGVAASPAFDEGAGGPAVVVADEGGAGLSVARAAQPAAEIKRRRTSVVLKLVVESRIAFRSGHRRVCRDAVFDTEARRRHGGHGEDRCCSVVSVNLRALCVGKRLNVLSTVIPLEFRTIVSRRTASGVGRARR